MAFSLATRPYLASSSDAANPQAVVFGIPLDLTESFRPGTADAPSAIRMMSDSIETYVPLLDLDIADLSIRDAGDCDLSGLELTAALARIEHDVAALPAGALPVMFGGEHTLTLATVRALRRRYPNLRVLQVDAHMDLIDAYDGQPTCHATVFRRIADEIGADHIAQVGVRSGTAGEWRFAQNALISTPELRLTESVRRTLAGGPVYLSIDIDVLDPSAAPGTGCPEPGGPTYRELQSFLHSLAGLTVVAVDIVEVLPRIDPAGLAAVSAAKLARDAIVLFASRR